MTTTTRKHHGRTIDTDVRIRTTPMQAWEAWADPEKIANWFVDRAEGQAQPGEVMTWFFDTFNYRQPVPIVEAEPGRSFVIGSGDMPGPQGHPYVMEITIAQDRGETVMRLVNSGFSEDATFDDEYEGVVSGWKMALATLKYWLERHPSHRRTHRLAIEPASYSWDKLLPRLRSLDDRRAWLEPAIPADGAVLADTGREVMLAWDARHAVLGLKAFRMGPQQVIALDLSSWADGSQNLDAEAAEMQAALKRLAALLR